MRFYKNGKLIGERFCGVCDRPAVYSENRISLPAKKVAYYAQAKGIKIEEALKTMATQKRGNNIYRCGYHSPFRGIDRKTKNNLITLQ